MLTFLWFADYFLNARTQTWFQDFPRYQKFLSKIKNLKMLLTLNKMNWNVFLNRKLNEILEVRVLPIASVQWMNHESLIFLNRAKTDHSQVLLWIDRKLHLILFIDWARSLKFCPASKKSVHRLFENQYYLIEQRYILEKMFYLFNVAHSNTSTSSIQTGVNSERNNFDKSLWSVRNNYAHMVHMFISLNNLKSPLTRSKMDFEWIHEWSRITNFLSSWRTIFISKNIKLRSCQLIW